MTSITVRTLFESLREDRRRKNHPFSPDMREANALLHHPFVWRDEAVEALNRWCQGYQPCFFGKFAAKHHQIHFAILFEKDLHETDEAIAAKIAADKRLWKQRAIDDVNYPPHAFLLVVLSPRVALAAPDENLYRFACKIRDLAGWSPDTGTTAKDAVSHDFLYLPHPTEGLYYGYRFNVDFFAAAGDGRWWHDHRLPGGIAFTANSTGHMRYFREWYGKEVQEKLNDWFLTQAMNTVAAAHSFGTHKGRFHHQTSSIHRAFLPVQK
ncbi:MAG: hypothetical protein L0387_20920 [Acidobacteria bacterium]|nr:hypothetical protein [Acidobacteriota bacterium]